MGHCWRVRVGFKDRGVRQEFGPFWSHEKAESALIAVIGRQDVFEARIELDEDGSIGEDE